MTETGLAVITRAITLRLATLGETSSNDPELYGEPLPGQAELPVKPAALDAAERP